MCVMGECACTSACYEAVECEDSCFPCLLQLHPVCSCKLPIITILFLPIIIAASSCPSKLNLFLDIRVYQPTEGDES